MNVIDEKIEQLQAFQDNQAQIVLSLAKDIEHLIIDLNVSQLENYGIDSKGESIIERQPYAPLTIDIKRLKGQPTNRVTLKDEGDFHSSFFVFYGDSYFQIGADDPKARKLEEKYGVAIYGLTDENLQEIIDLIHPSLLLKFKNSI